MYTTAALRTSKEVNRTGSARAPQETHAKGWDREAGVLKAEMVLALGPELCFCPRLVFFLSETVHFITRVLQSRTAIAAGPLNAECFILDNGLSYI